MVIDKQLSEERIRLEASYRADVQDAFLTWLVVSSPSASNISCDANTTNTYSLDTYTACQQARSSILPVCHIKNKYTALLVAGDTPLVLWFLYTYVIRS